MQQPLLQLVVQQGSHAGGQAGVQQGSHTGMQQVVGQQHALRHRRLCPASASQPDATTATQVSVPTKQRSRVFLPIIVEPLESLGGETGRAQRGPTFPKAGNGRPGRAGEASSGGRGEPPRRPAQRDETSMILAWQRERGHGRSAGRILIRQFPLRTFAHSASPPNGARRRRLRFG